MTPREASTQLAAVKGRLSRIVTNAAYRPVGTTHIIMLATCTIIRAIVGGVV